MSRFHVGIPIFPIQEISSMVFVGDGEWVWRDDFNDDILHPDWLEYLGDNPAGKSIIESAGRINFHVGRDVNAKWEGILGGINQAPRVGIGIPSGPVEIIARLNTFTAEHESHAGIFISPTVLGTGVGMPANYFPLVLEYNEDWGPDPFLNFKERDLEYPMPPAPGLPLFLRMRKIAGGFGTGTIFYDYSTDGETWINLGFYKTDLTNPILCAGLYVGNGEAYGSPYGQIDAGFDFFEVKLLKGPE